MCHSQSSRIGDLSWRLLRISSEHKFRPKTTAVQFTDSFSLISEGKTNVKKVAAEGVEDYNAGGNEVKTTK